MTVHGDDFVYFDLECRHSIVDWVLVFSFPCWYFRQNLPLMHLRFPWLRFIQICIGRKLLFWLVDFILPKEREREREREEFESYKIGNRDRTHTSKVTFNPAWSSSEFLRSPKSRLPSSHKAWVVLLVFCNWQIRWERPFVLRQVNRLENWMHSTMK